MARLQSGDAAPGFSLENMRGRAVSLADFRGRRVWLALFRFAGCPFCLRRVHQLGLASDRISALPLERIAVFPSKRELLEKYVAKFPLPFEVLSDPDQGVYKAYGGEKSLLGTAKSMRHPSHAIAGIRSVPSWSAFDGGGSKFQLPADFLLDEQHRIGVAYYGKEADDGIDLASVERFVASG